MAVMIKLKLPEQVHDVEKVQALPGLAGIEIDPEFGLVPIDPRESLYVVRAVSMDDLERRRSLSPEIVGAYGDVKISTAGPP